MRATGEYLFTNPSPSYCDVIVKTYTSYVIYTAKSGRCTSLLKYTFRLCLSFNHTVVLLLDICFRID